MLRRLSLLVAILTLITCAPKNHEAWPRPWEDRDTLLAAYLANQDIASGTENRAAALKSLTERSDALIARVTREWSESVAPVRLYDFDAMWDGREDLLDENERAFTHHLFTELRSSGLLEEIDGFAGTRRLHPSLDGDVSHETFNDIPKRSSRRELFVACLASMMLDIKHGHWQEASIWLDRALILNSISALNVSLLDVLIVVAERHAIDDRLMRASHEYRLSNEFVLHIQDSLEQINYRDLYSYSITLASVIAIPGLIDLELLAKNPPSDYELAIMISPELAGARASDPSHYAELQSRIDRYRDTLIAASKLPGAEALAALPDDELPEEIARDLGAVEAFDSYIDLSYSADRWGIRKILQAESMDHATLIVLALHLYRTDHGSFPDTLDDLVPRYLNEVSRDHFATDGRLRYSPATPPATGFTLYSVGPSGSDEGGRWPNDWYYPPGAFPRDE